MPNSKNNREGDDEYSGVIAQLGERARVVICRDRIQYIIQTRDGAAWRSRRFFTTRSSLIAQLPEVVPTVDSEVTARLAGLPTFAKDYRVDTRHPYSTATAPETAEAP